MAVKTRTVAICYICGFMVEAIGDGSIECAEAPDNWGHGKNGNVDICPKCAKKLERPEWNYRSTGGTRDVKGFNYADKSIRKK